MPDYRGEVPDNEVALNSVAIVFVSGTIGYESDGGGGGPDSKGYPIRPVERNHRWDFPVLQYFLLVGCCHRLGYFHSYFQLIRY